MKRTRERVLGLLDDDDEPMSAQERVEPARAPALLEVSVIIPARNEARNIATCLESLIAQSEPGFSLGGEWQILVIDDASSDATSEIATQTYERLLPISAKSVAQEDALQLAAAGEIEPGLDRGAARAAAFGIRAAPALEAHARLTGKNNACWAGAQGAQGRWLLFTDADTRFEPGSLSRSLREAERHEVVLLSYSPRQVLTGPAQHLVTPLIFSELASVYPPAEVNDPGQPLAAANGQFLLVDRATYFAVGGHRAVGGNVLEDVSLARNVKRSGGRIRLRHASEALSTRMYRTTAEMVEGWTKNLAALMPSPVVLAGWRLLDFVLLLALPALAIALPHLVLWQRAAIGVIALRTALRYYTRVARAHAGFVDTALSPLGLPLFVFLLLRSTWAYRVSRRVTWKGRSYDPNRT